jgi:lysophospholipase L1-like esterase
MALHESFLSEIVSKKGDLPIIFYGDSLTERWKEAGVSVFEANYGSMEVCNFGISGDRTQHLLWRLQNGEADPILKTKVAVVLIGGNNRNDPGITPEKVYQGIKANVFTIREKMPKTTILLLGMIPALENVVAETLITIVNGKASTLHDGEYIHFFNMYNAFLNANGTIDWDLYNEDKIHLTEEGYKVWAKAMNPLLFKLLEASSNSSPRIINESGFVGLILALLLQFQYFYV